MMVLYDGDCGVCQWFVGHMRSMTGSRFEWFPYQRFGEEELGAMGLSAAECAHAIQVGAPGGEWLGGADGINAILLANRSFRPLISALGAVPGALAIERIAYRLFARHRAGISQRLGMRACKI